MLEKVSLSTTVGNARQSLFFIDNLLKQTSVKCLKLFVPFTLASGICLNKLLWNNSSFTNLSLSIQRSHGRNITKSDMAQFIEELGVAISSNPVLRSLDLDFSTFDGTPTNLLNLLTGLISSQSLERLRLNMNSTYFLGSYKDLHFANYNRQVCFEETFQIPLHVPPTNLKYLSLERCGLHYIRDFLCNTVLPNCPKLLELDLSSNYLDDFDYNHIASVISERSSIVSLNLSQCKLDDNGVEVFANLLSQNRSLMWLNLIGNDYSLMGRLAIADVCNQQKARKVKILTSHPSNVIDVTGYTVVLEHVKSLQQLLDLCDVSNTIITTITFFKCNLLETNTLEYFFSLLKEQNHIVLVEFLDSRFSYDAFLVVYDELRYIKGINLNLGNYQLNVNSGFLGFAGRFEAGIPSNLIDSLVTRDIKVFDCSKATFGSASNDLELGLELLKADVCSFSTRRVKWNGKYLELDLHGTHMDLLIPFQSYSCLKKLNLSRISDVDCSYLSPFPLLEDLNLSFISSVKNYPILKSFPHLDKRPSALFRDETRIDTSYY
ncbi:hypothetical protein GEMRC1_010409 [Eukaryota sp. GEM-RC1]